MPSKSREEKAEFCMEFIGHSDSYRSQYVEGWIETLDNFTVAAHRGAFDTADPFRRGARTTSLAMDSIFLKDPETHKAIMTYAAKLVRAVLGEPRGEYIRAVPVGWEDAIGAAPTVTRLLRYAFRLPGHFRAFVESILDMLLFGTGIMEVGWRYEEREMPVREAQSVDGIESFGEMTRQRVPVHDDVDLTPVDVQDFYPDPGEYRIERMRACAKRFRSSLPQARTLAKSGLYIGAGVDEINEYGGPGGNTILQDRFREGLDQPFQNRRLGAFKELIGYEFWGEVPWEEDDGSSRRVLTVLDGILVRDDPWPLADPELPFKSFVINPLTGRFYGISPAEVIRYDQDFADVLKELIARAVIRQVHPPIAFDPDSEVDQAMLRRWRTDMPIPVRGGPASVGTLRYDANVGSASGLLSFLKDSMQGASGAQGGIQGEPGPSREAATAAQFRMQSAMDRPELVALLLERETLPSIGKAVLRRYQQFLEDSEELGRRIGQLPEGMWIGDILSDFDVEFVGSRMAMTRQQKLQAYDRLAAMAGAIPPLQAQIPWDALAKNLIGDILELPEVAAAIGNPDQTAQNMLISSIMGGSRRGGGSVAGGEPTDIVPAQAVGEALGGP